MRQLEQQHDRSRPWRCGWATTPAASTGTKATGTPVTVGFVNYVQDAIGDGQSDELKGAQAAVD